MAKWYHLNWKIWLLVAMLVLSLIAISPSPLRTGVMVKSVDINSTEGQMGISTGEIITELNGQQITNLADYAKAVESITGAETKKLITTNEQEYIYMSFGKPSLEVVEVPRSNIKAGLDLIGGSRALVRPEKQVSTQELEDLIATMQNRFNVYGLSDVRVRPVTDLEGNKFVLVEVAGATVQDLKELISQQGKFEAKIAGEVVFIGGDRDVTSVCRFDPSCSGIRECSASGNQEICNFQFVVYLSESAAKRHADITGKLSTNISTPGYLSDPLDLFIDEKLADSLLISEDLKGVVTTQVLVSGSGIGMTREEAVDDTLANMKRLQTVLITGSLPFKLEIEKLDSISPIVGEKLSQNILMTAVIAFLSVSLFIFLRYRNIKLVLPILLTMISEVIIILGVASLIHWNLDLASIAGIIVVIGTGLDHQIIIIDEVKLGRIYGWKEKMKRAFFIIFGAFATTFVAMLPLAWAGAGLLKGFAITTIMGITAGILITRPAFAEMIKQVMKD